jgi:amidase
MTNSSDPLHAFCTHAEVLPAGPDLASVAVPGPLWGKSFAVKDVFALQGARACFGNPTWLATHEPATSTAAVVTQLLEIGARLIGTTITDELAFSLTGENAHFGTPINSAAPDRVPGGSSSGSAAAVAGGRCDFALGTDTGGSVRVPASHCGLFGFRPSHGLISLDGVLPLAPRFDTVGWFARDAATLAAVGDVLLPAPTAAGAPPLTSTWLVEDAIAPLHPAVAGAFRRAAGRLVSALGLPSGGGAAGDGEAGELSSWLSVYLTLQNADIARVHGDFVARERPSFGTLIAGRMARALAVTADEVIAAGAQLLRVRQRLAALVEGGTVLVLPSAGGVAPLRGQPDGFIDDETGRSLTLSAIASLGGLPQVSLPLCRVQGLPLGVSLIAAPGRDRSLLALARSLHAVT